MANYKKEIINYSKSINIALSSAKVLFNIDERINEKEKLLIRDEMLKKALEAFNNSLVCHNTIENVILNKLGVVIQLNENASIKFDILQQFINDNFIRCNEYLLTFGVNQPHKLSQKRFINILVNDDILLMKLNKPAKIKLLKSRVNNELFEHIINYTFIKK